jgi:tRNA nucleotidyltransferase (CCA-adding enzyme)
MRIPRPIHAFASVFTGAGFQCYLVGGAVRDLLVGRVHTDWDIATDARPEQVMGIFRRVIPTGIKHGTVTVLFQNLRFEVTTFRIESGYSDGRRPDSVTFAPTIFQDLARRDFTMNAIAYDLATGALHDPHDGQVDLAHGIIRAIGEADERFREDGLRPVRACRFAAQFGFTVEEKTREAIGRSLDVAAGVSAERVRDEIVKIVDSPSPSTGFMLMRDTGLLRVFLPELADGEGIKQGELHCYDILTHSLYACDAAPPGDTAVRLAALLHDVGKPRARGTDERGHVTFYGHEHLGAEMASAILERLRFPNVTIKRVSHLIDHHMFNYQEEWKDSAVRRLIARVGEENIADLMALRRADQVGMCRENAAVFPEGLARFAERVAAVREGERAFTLRQLAVRGQDLMERMGIPPGPVVGTILNELLSTVLEDPAMNEKEKLLEVAERFYRQRMSPES